MLLARNYQQLKNIYHFLQSRFWQAFYHFPDRDMKIYGVTGTNGKTTTCILLGNILREAYGNEKVGLLTTIVFWIGAREIVNKTKMTTMDSRLVWQYIRQMKDAQVKNLVLEVTSHALDQRRLAGIKLNGAIILNIAREHLDYHKTMEEYAKAKGKIVQYLKPGSSLVVKGDDRFVGSLISQKASKKPLYPFSLHREKVRMRVDMAQSTPRPALSSNRERDFSTLSQSKSKLQIIEFTSNQAQKVITPLLGEVNKENVLAATLLARGIGIDEKVIERGVAKVNQVPGRMEWVDLPPDKGGGLPRVLIDYAVTPDALERLYREIKQQTTGKIFAVLGACGNRDRGKRPDMARVVAKYASELVLTREDPWTENEEQIFQDLEKGLTATATRWIRIIDRREAIKYCLQKGEPQDIVVITGKGAEEGMALGKNIIPWNDKKVILELLNEKIKSNAKSKVKNSK